MLFLKPTFRIVAFALEGHTEGGCGLNWRCRDGVASVPVSAARAAARRAGRARVRPERSAPGSALCPQRRARPAAHSGTAHHS